MWVAGVNSRPRWGGHLPEKAGCWEASTFQVTQLSNRDTAAIDVLLSNNHHFKKQQSPKESPMATRGLISTGPIFPQ